MSYSPRGSSRALLVTLALFLLPHFATAAVVINEIAWMGTVSSANDEWIELYNNGATAVALDGWTLSGDGLAINLSGTLASGGYALLERTDDSSAPGTAFLIYTGALSNSGATLSLHRSDGGVEDQVAGGENWENIGGDNTTKETAQRTPGGWITAAATPGGANASSGSVSGDTNAGDSNSSANNSGESSQASKKEDKAPKPVSKLSITAPSQAYVNQPVSFDVSPSDGVERLVRYTWSFGDAASTEEKSPIHTYAYPGNYVVMVESYYAKETVMGRHEITVLPAILSIARTDNGDIQIHNNAQYEVDISNFELYGSTSFRIPKHTILLPRATLTIPHDRIEENTSHIMGLSDPEGVVVAAYTPYMKTEEDGGAGGDYLGSATEAMPHTAASTEVSNEPLVLKPKSSGAAAASMAIPGEGANKNLPYLGVGAVLLLGILGVYLRSV